MKPSRERRISLALAGTALFVLVTLLQVRLQAALRLQSPLPEPETACFNQTLDGFTLALFGYVTQPDGTTTLTWRVTNVNKKDISYVAFGTGGWTPVAPADDGVIPGVLGDYHVEWTNEHGNPGFASIKYETEFDGFSQGAEDIFVMEVSDFDPSESIQVQMKAGKNKTTFTVIFDGSGCDWSPTPTPTATPESPLPTPTATPSVPLTDTLPALRTLILDDEFSGQPLTEEEKIQRWQQGLPVPLLDIPDESDLPIEWGPWSEQPQSSTIIDDEEESVIASMSSKVPGLAAPVSAPVITDGWELLEYETFEESVPVAGGCNWRVGHLSSGDAYDWGRDTWRAKNGSFGWWPAGQPQDSSPEIPGGYSYPDNLQTWWQCELYLGPDTNNVMTEFELWYELDTLGDKLELRFHDTGCDQANDTTYRNGILWQGTESGVVNVSDQWENYRVFYPSLADSGIGNICVEFKFTSDDIDNNLEATQGPWLDDVQMSAYSKPYSSYACQDKDPTVYLIGAPGDGRVSKGLVVPPYVDDIRAGVVDNPDNTLDIAGMVQRLRDADVHWVRLEFIIPPEELNRIGYGLDSIGISHVDLRHYDRIVDMLCANDIAVLGLVDYQSLPRQDWDSDIEGYKMDFTSATRQLVKYFDDRIRYWEVWNEPNFAPTGFPPAGYADLLIATYDAIKSVDTNDQVLFGGLAQAAGNSFQYLANVTIALDRAGRGNPAPYDIFTLHPYPSDEYRLDGRVVVDPNIYLHWREENNPGPTTIYKFLDTMANRHGKGNQPLWITEIGWNRARDNIENAAVNENCPAVSTTMVSGFQQSQFAVGSFDILFKETGWDSSTPSVSKIFWYQYVDVGIPSSQCYQAAVATTPSGPTSYLARGGVSDQLQDDDPNWWFGLYQGINWDQGGIIEPVPVKCVYRQYPIYNPAPIFDCHGVVVSPAVYLPYIEGGAVTQ
ncbi:MAG: cellulase family glycosylhydrolase [Caldilineaceae bacterium]|nr:cellulase family glycosylhydrolase [Caldilineaceae bacterium]